MDRTPIHVLKRGVWENKGEAVGPRPPRCWSRTRPSCRPTYRSSPPTGPMAGPPGHPLTARVIVNRLWQHHFGAGIVKTVNDFGTQGDRPSHPSCSTGWQPPWSREGWRLKPIHRLILLSATYRQSDRSEQAEDAAADDPEDRLLWHSPAGASRPRKSVTRCCRPRAEAPPGPAGRA